MRQISTPSGRENRINRDCISEPIPYGRIYTVEVLLIFGSAPGAGSGGISTVFAITK